ncbi:MAG TPA: hypothetical protein VE913_00050 [Longimicrobium sp.]|nr:hypothetical protein [Longimicrobium sp.]
MNRSGVAVLVGTMLAGCGGGGGELREATERRRAETSGLDSASTDPAAPASGAPAEAYRVPAFVDTTGAPGEPPAASVPGPAADTTPATSSAPASPNPPPARDWSAADRRGRGSARGVTTLRAMRVGRNAGFDRLVLDFGSDPAPSYEVEYVDGPVRSCGSGEATPVAGRGWLRIRLRAARAHDGAGTATVTNREISTVMPVLREVEMICDFEGQVEIVMGVQTPNPYRVLVEPSPNRLIVDVRQ